MVGLTVVLVRGDGGAWLQAEHVGKARRERRRRRLWVQVRRGDTRRMMGGWSVCGYVEVGSRPRKRRGRLAARGGECVYG